jgi:acetylornithine deacetylase
MNQHETALMESVAALGEKQIQWTRDLVAIATVNPYSGDASAGTEAPGQVWVEDKLKGLGAKTQRIGVPENVYALAGYTGPAGRKWGAGRENVIGRWVLGNGKGRTILLNDHIDTVGTEGMEFDPFDPRIVDGKMYGRGTSDTKGNLVVGLIAIEALLRNAQGLNGQIVFESVVDEECDGAGAGTVACCLAGVTGDVAIGLDGSAGGISSGCNGIATAKIFVRGKAGHNAAGASVNAIDKGILVKEAIDRFAAERIKKYPTCRTNIGIFRSGTLPSIVPGLAEIQVNNVYSPRDAEKAFKETGKWGSATFQAEFEKAIRDAVAGDAWLQEKPVEISWVKNPYPFETDPELAEVKTAVAAASEVFGKEIPARPMPAWFDGAHLSRMLGVPTFGMGSGTPGTPHSATEHVIVDDLLKGAKAVALTMRRLLGG